MKHKIKMISLILFLIFGFSGCSKRLGYINTNKVINTENTILKSYEINKPKSSYIGSPMISVGDYTTIKKASDEMKPTEDFIFNTDGSTQYHFTTNDIFKIKGTWEIDGIIYTVVNHPKMNSSNLLIRDDGVIHNKIVNVIPYGFQQGDAITVIYTYRYEPFSVRLNTITNTTNEIRKGKINYELIYTGTDKDSFMLTYREYTAENLARTSFFQNLTYPRDSSTIRFRNLLIKINSIDSQKINFIVLNDSAIN